MGSARSLRPVGVAPRRSGITATDRYVAAIHALAFPLGRPCGPLGRPFENARLAEVLGVAPVSAREVLLRLERDGLVERALRRRWALTDGGLARADEVVRRQRIVVRFLVDELAFPVADAYVDGVPLGVSIGARTAERMLARIGAPDRDPSGWPIDLERDRAEAPSLVRALDAPIGTAGVVARLSRHPRSLVAELHDAGCVPGRSLRVVAGLGGRPAWLLGDGEARRPLPEALAGGVWLRAVDAR
ncbi:iron dependent repressor, metal binding and dimerization domain protein [Patulibacter brassicae]|jgi:DtxR family Mn-dependent transcriptional regulator|uniref:Iron dependent repressor, metal binding and dimerization domain protein n=1 Tax=Patulibacter brassicae TaxID=1705717 RepID=A0ABU4VHN5_9ACTN|nr:iron dependent repressor, metal binding and dimerization domain protein [Patulibacter brassicae]MDX8151327.1 iron dependent repressor, metal binding and dimerization domain protein [Patulibacter brassicae]